MSIETLRNSQTPYPFSSRKDAGRDTPRLYENTLSIGKKEIERLQEIDKILRNPFIDELVEDGKITLGIIKPNANKGVGLPQDDDKAADFLREEIGNKYIIFDFNIQLTTSQIETFYADVKEKYSDKYNKPGNKKTIWEEVDEMLHSGPVTFLLLYCEEGNAVDWWRKKMGKTHPEEADPKTLRGKYAREENMPNNLTHGSDSIEGAKREISVLKDIVHETVERCVESAHNFPNEDDIKHLGIINEADTLLSILRFYDSGMRAESWIYGYEVTYQTQEGAIKSKKFREKNMISMGSDLEGSARIHVDRYRQLNEIGVRTPRIYGAKRATIYTDFIENNQTKEVLENLELQKRLTPNSRKVLDQLIVIAARLDTAGFSPLNFINDLIYDGNTGQFMYVDVGFDLGEKGNQRTSNSKNILIKRFPGHETYIKKEYQTRG